MPRDIILTRLKKDLVGPFGNEDEVIDYTSDGPDKEYLLGKLYPQNYEPDENAIEELLEESSGMDITHRNEEEIGQKRQRMCSAGITFYIRPDDNLAAINIVYSLGKYTYQTEDKSGIWNRANISNNNNPLNVKLLSEDADEVIVVTSDFEELSFHIKTRVHQKNTSTVLAISVFALNENKYNDEEDSFESQQEKIFFQFGFQLTAEIGEIIPIPGYLNPLSENQLNNFLYRDKRTYAIGHGASAAWDELKKIIIRTEWFPDYFIPDMSSEGHDSIKEIDFSAKRLSNISNKELIETLEFFINNYSTWIKQEASISLKENETYEVFKEALNGQIDISAEHLKRMNASIQMLKNDGLAFEAFKLANEALAMQYAWSNIPLKWRPFQIGFLLISLESTLNKNSVNRDEVDLLWFPTGGGKTEAYLFLSSTLLFYRKLYKGSLNSKDGLAIISRYTMRALTIDQFKRMAAMILASEYIRRKTLKVQNTKVDLASTFSIGMWVGGDATPNTIKQMVKDDAYESLKKMTVCPCCNQMLEWHSDKRPNDFRPVVLDLNKQCSLSKEITNLPIYVIDEYIYERPPSAIIGTVDKFVQVIRRPADARKIFSIDNNEIASPDLIIQDELHLISGPLGSISGLIEILIEEYATKDNISPKVIGSTATIQRADEQIKGLYGKHLLQFPVNISSADDSFFSNIDNESPGRVYVGLTSADSSATYILQAMCGILLQSLNSKNLIGFSKKQIDPYTTIVAYFNTIRILSGSKVVLQDDTAATIASYADKYNEKPYEYEIPEELTSANSQEELEDILNRLEKDYKEEGYIAILLASVMISVGLDISRMGLMIVDGQPKSIAEYIQATSRVGRGKVPGLVLTLFNNFKPRDKSYYETFINWHGSLYRYVESTGVTPFSSRARQKIFPALVISLGLKTLNRVKDDFSINLQEKRLIEKEVKQIILNKINFIDRWEAREAEIEIDEIISNWFDRGNNIKYLFNDYDELNSLLMSAEAQAAKQATDMTQDIAFASPNSAREVEPSVRIKGYKALTDTLLRGN